MIIIATFVLHFLYQQNKIGRIIERSVTEKKISKRLHDEIGNDYYYQLQRLIDVPEFSSIHGYKKIINGFNALYERLRNFSRDINIETGEAFHDELIFLLNSYNDQDTTIITKGSNKNFWTKVSAHKKVELFHILKELLTNMKKHSNAKVVSIIFKKEKRKIAVEYYDNGIGVNFDQPFSKNGLRNVENRIKEIKGTCTFTSEPGKNFKANVVFKP